MNLLEILHQGLATFEHREPIENGASISTHCLYPSNAAVMVSVRGAGGSYVVSDDGGALHEASTAGAALAPSVRRYEKLVEKQGLLFQGGIICTPQIGLEYVPMAVLLVANSSKEVADQIFSSWRAPAKRDFKEAVKDLVRSRLTGVTIKEERLVGLSKKPHQFDNVIHLPQGRRVVVDPVLHDPNSINSRVVTHLDLKAGEHEGLQQRIVYDDSEKWTSADLSLLQVSQVPVIAFSKAALAIEALRAA